MIVHDKSGNFVKGVGSVLDISPDTDYQKVVCKQSIKARIYNSWVRVGQNIQTATKQYQNGQKAKK